jgi:thymidylate kinase
VKDAELSGIEQNMSPVLVSFSGIDGAGKSTQIDRLSKRLREVGLTVSRITFWTEVAALRRFRESMSHRVFQGDRGVGRPGKPVKRRDKNIRAWYLTVLRCTLYLFDIVKLNFVVRSARRRSRDVVIFDRYIYDELANLSLENALTRKFIESLLTIVPKPDLPLVLNAEPATACTRKPEYPEAFLHTNRASFLDVARIAGLVVIDVKSIEETGLCIEESLQDCFPSLRSRIFSAVYRRRKSIQL